MEDVARAAEVSRQCVYGYFPSKEVLFRAMVVHILDTTLSKIEDLRRNGNGSLQDKLIEIFEKLAGRQASQSIGGRLELSGAFFTHIEKDMASQYVSRLDDLVSGFLADAVSRKELSLDRATPLEVAQTLREVSEGIASRCEDTGDFRLKMARALRVVLPPLNRGAGRTSPTRKES